MKISHHFSTLKYAHNHHLISFVRIRSLRYNHDFMITKNIFPWIVMLCLFISSGHIHSYGHHDHHDHEHHSNNDCNHCIQVSQIISPNKSIANIFSVFQYEPVVIISQVFHPLFKPNFQTSRDPPC